MQIRALQTMAVIRDLGSFREAAERLNMTLSAVSMQMKVLESELGVSLFDRSFRPPKLTPQGLLLADHATDMVRRHAEIVALCSGEASLTGVYRIGFVGTASVRLLPGFLERAQTGAPDASFRIETGLSEALARKVRQGDLDAAVVTQVDADPDMRFEPLRTEELVFALPLSAGEWTIATCAAALVFLQFTPDTGIGRLVARYLRNSGLRPDRQIVLDGVESVMECVTAGMGFTALPKPDVVRYGGSKVIVRPMAEPPLTRTLGLISRADSLGAQPFSDLAALLA